MRASSGRGIGSRGERSLGVMRGAGIRRGSVLIEVMIALILLAMSGSALITLLGQTAHSMRRTLESERLARGASEQLGSLMIATRGELLSGVGRTVVRGWTIQISAASTSLFEVSIAASDSGAPLLRTTLYRPDSLRSDARH